VENETNAPAAAESAPTLEPTNDRLSHSAAAALLAEWDPNKPEETPAEAAPEITPETPEITPAEAEAGTEDPAEEAAPAEEAEPKPNEPEDEYVNGNKRTRLRDGTVTTVGELKKLAETGKEYLAVKPQLDAYARQLHQERQRLASQEQLFKQVLPIAQQVMEQKLPQAPDPQLATDDPIEHYQQMVRYQAEMGRFNQLRAAQQAQMAQAQQAQQYQVQQHLAQQRTRLAEIMPELRDDAKRAEFSKKFVNYAKEVGFSEQEAAQVYDARLMQVVSDGIKWREHLAKQAAAKPIVAAKAANAVPVAAPARREPSKDAAASQREQLIQKALKSGRPQDAAAALSHF
jgi:hypothetical protein